MPARKPKHDPQPALFADFDTPLVALAPRARTFAPLAATLPAHVRVGTSSWTFPSWETIVYDRKYAQDALTYEGLAAYSSHPLFRTVGLDRTFYRPMSADDLALLAARVPAHFRFLVKAHGDITRPPQPGETASKFLDIAWTRDQVLAPSVQGLQSKLGVILFQFPPIDLRPASFTGGIDAFIDQLAAFLASLPASVPCAVEVRNRELLSNQHRDRYNAAIRQAGVEHCYSGHPSMPTIGTQLDLIAPAPVSPAPVTCRWLLHPSQRYEEAKDRYFPFHALKDEDPGTRAEITRLARVAGSLARDILIIVNNKAEGSAPISIEQLATQIASDRA
jgi:uncharacterized protein YecE (DUF72 family)